jgi:4Fe-4S single cluster domain
MNRTHHIVIDRIACTGHGLCAELFSEHFALDEWDYPIQAPAPIASIIGALLADAVLVALGETLMPGTKGYAHFRFADYGKPTVIGVLIVMHLAIGAALPNAADALHGESGRRAVPRPPPPAIQEEFS